MKKKHYKLKKQVWYVVVIIIFLIIGIIALKKIKANYVYKQTYEYKLLNKDYTLKEIKLLEKYLNNQELDELLKKDKDSILLGLMQEKNFQKNNLDRYLTYLKETKSKNYQEIVFKVNLNLDYNFYENTKEADLSKDYLILVNKFYYLPSDYEPDDLVNISNKCAWGDDKKIRKDVYDAFLKMWEDAYNEDIYLIINLGYRDYNTQDELYNRYVKLQGKKYADKITTRAGFSEHQTGLALDILERSNSNFETFKESKAYTWLKENAYKYGFILRYTEENENITGFNAEDWHYRYVGIDVAKKIYEDNITFEEYYTYNVK